MSPFSKILTITAITGAALCFLPPLSQGEEQSAPSALPRDMGRSEFDANQMLKYTVNPVSGNLVVRIPQIHIPSQRGSSLDVTLTYNSQWEENEAFSGPPSEFGGRWAFSYSSSLQVRPFWLCHETGDWGEFEIQIGDLLSEEPEWENPECCEDEGDWPPECCDPESVVGGWPPECCPQNTEWPPPCYFEDFPECCPQNYQGDWPPTCCDAPFPPCCDYPWPPEYCNPDCCDDYFICVEMDCDPYCEQGEGHIKCFEDCTAECLGNSDPEECRQNCYNGCVGDCKEDCYEDCPCAGQCIPDPPPECDWDCACGEDCSGCDWDCMCGEDCSSCDWDCACGPDCSSCDWECPCAEDCSIYTEWDCACGEDCEFCEWECPCAEDCEFCYWDHPCGDGTPDYWCDFHEGGFEQVDGFLFYNREGDPHFIPEMNIEPDKNPYHYDVDFEGRTITFKDGTRYHFGSGVGLGEGTLSSIEDRYGNMLTKNITGNLVTDAVGRTITWGFNDDSQVETLTDPANRVFQYHYEGGQLVEIVNPENGVTRFEYKTFTEEIITPRGRKFTKNYVVLTKITYPEGNSVHFEYELGKFKNKFKYKCTRVWKDSGIEEHTYFYSENDGNGSTTVTDSRDNVTFQYFTESGIKYFETSLVEQIKDPYGEYTYYSFDDYHHLTNTSDTNGRVGYMTYDSLGNMLTKGFGGYTTTFTYETEYNQITSITDPNGNVKYFHYGNPAYGPPGSLWKEVDAEGFETCHWSNDSGQRIKTQDARGNITFYGYGEWGYLTEVTQVTQEGTYTTQYSYDVLGNKIEKINANGVVTTYEYDSMNRLEKESVHDEGGPFETSYEYDFNGNLRFKTDPNENTTEYVYDDADRLEYVIEPEERITYYEYDTESNKEKETDPNGNATTYEYDEFNRLRFEFDPKGGVVEYIYDGSGDNSTQNGSRRYNRKKDKYTRKIDANVHHTDYLYDKLYRLERETDHLSCYIEYGYDPVGNKVAERDKRGYWTEFSYNPRNLLEQITDPKGYIVEYQYDEVGNKSFEKDKKGNWTEFSYDERNLLIGITDPLGNIVSYEYDGVGNKRFETDKRENTTEFQYNGRNLLRYVINDVEGEVIITEYEYDANGNKKVEIDPNGLPTRFAYDELNRLVSKTDALWNTLTHTYDPNGNRTSITDANGNATEYEYDELNRLVLVTDALDKETMYAYDRVGNKTSTTDARWNTTTYRYDELNRLIGTIDPLENSIIYGYDCNGNREWQNDGNGNIIEYEYDKLNRLEHKFFPDGEEVTYTYDPNGNRETMVDPHGTIDYHYDELNRLDWTTVYGEKTISYGYDPNSNRLSMTSPDFGTIEYPEYDEINRLKQIVAPYNGTTTYDYDPGSRLEGMTYPNGAVVAYDYDDANRLLGQITKFNQQTITSFEYSYDNVGNRLTMIDLQGTTTYQYDDLYRLTDVTYPDASWGEYSYDAVGNRLYHYSPAGTVACEYNDANELTFLSQDYVSSTITVTGSVSDLDEYGSPGQLDSVTVNGVPAEVSFNTFTAYEVPIELGENMLTAVAVDLGGKVSQDTVTVQVTKEEENYISFDYDGNGNLIQKDDHGQNTTYEYDFENRLTKVTLPGGASFVEFTYDGDKRRLSKKAVDGTVTRFLYDGLNILQDLDGSGNIKTAYLQGIGIDKLIAVSEWEVQTAPPTVNYYHSDAIGSVRSLTDEDGSEVKTYAYDAWGKITAQTGSSSNEYKFTSRRWEEEIGLQYNRARFYDPELGRFITRDPLTGGPDDPTISYFSGVYSAFHRFIKEHIDALQSNKLNRYVYCYNNPINLIDPLGLSADEDATAEVKVEADQAETGQKEEEKAGQPQTTGTEQAGQTAGDVAEEETGFDWDKTRPTVPKLSEIQAEREQGKLAEQRERMSGHDKRSMEKNLAKARERALRKQGLATGAYESWKQFGISGVRKGGFVGWGQRVAATAMMTSIDFFGARSVEMNAGRTGWAVGMGDTGEALWYGGLTVGQIALEAGGAAASMRAVRAARASHLIRTTTPFTTAERGAIAASDSLHGMDSGRQLVNTLADSLSKRGYTPKQIVKMLGPLKK